MPKPILIPAHVNSHLTYRRISMENHAERNANVNFVTGNSFGRPQHMPMFTLPTQISMLRKMGVFLNQLGWERKPLQTLGNSSRKPFHHQAQRLQKKCFLESPWSHMLHQFHLTYMHYLVTKQLQSHRAAAICDAACRMFFYRSPLTSLMLGFLAEVNEEAKWFVNSIQHPFSEDDMLKNSRGRHWFSIAGHDRNNKGVSKLDALSFPPSFHHLFRSLKQENFNRRMMRPLPNSFNQGQFSTA